MPKKKARSPIVEALPLACSDETAAVEFLEDMRWDGEPLCPRCKSTDIYKLRDRKTKKRNRRFLWVCRACKRQFTVRIGTVMEESRIPMRHWVYAFWAACASKKGVSALQIKRQTGLSYKSALFLMHRVRYAMTEDFGTKLEGIIEADETYVGGKPRNKGPHNKRGLGTKKTPVLALVQRDGSVRVRQTERVNAKAVGEFIRSEVRKGSRLFTDESQSYEPIGREWFAKHLRVVHSAKEYSRNGINVNTAESFFALVKRGMYGVFHSVSKRHLHRYLSEFEFRFNHRHVDDGERTRQAIRGAEGKRLRYYVSTS